MRLWHVVLYVLVSQCAALAGTNDYWQVSLRACDVAGSYTQFNCDTGTKPTSSDGLDASDTKAPLAAACAWISSADLGPGNGYGYSADWRASIDGSSKTWNLEVRVGSQWSKADVYLRVWNPSGGFDINGTIPISLEVASDPTGTYPAGHKLISSWDPALNGNQAAPAYTFTFSNAAALLTGAAIELKLIAGSSAATPCTIGQARGEYAGELVLVSGVAASSGSGEHAGLWVTSDGLPGLRVSSGPEVARGEVVDLAGVVTWMDGVPVLTNPEVKGRHGTVGPEKRALSNQSLANDRRESLDYSGVNAVGLLCVTCGEVTARDSDSGLFYVDDGASLADGLGPEADPYRGLRVSCPTGLSLPGLQTHVRVTGIRSVEKHVLANHALVNGELRNAGETVYVPVVVVRDSGDILPITQ